MKYKLIIFDLDGVLIDTKILHYKALNEALGLVDEKYCISESEHLLEYDGLKTFQKLNLLTERKNLPVCEHSKIWDYKQRFTLKSLADTEPNLSLKELLCKLTNDGYKIGCCSNSIRKTVLLVLAKLGIIEYFDVVLSNDDVRYCKPHPEMYWKCMSEIGVLPAETLIIEDSPVGLLGAKRSGASVMRIDSPHQLCYDKINIMLNKSKNTESIKWKGEDLNVLIPMAGAGSRFEAAGYTFPKPLIEVNGKPMIQVVVENLNVEANFIFVVNKTHRSKYNLDVLLNLISPNCRIVEAEGLTEGAACTTLLAKEYINNGASLLIANSDQFVEWNSVEFMYKMIEQRVDSGILTFTSTHPKWSFAKVNERGYVTEVAEKKPISDIATTGIYYWAKGSEYVKYAEQMIKNNIRVNNEFYVCPVFNEAIKDNKKIKTYNAKCMWGLGTPEDLELFLKSGTSF